VSISRKIRTSSRSSRISRTPFKIECAAGVKYAGNRNLPAMIFFCNVARFSASNGGYNDHINVIIDESQRRFESKRGNEPAQRTRPVSMSNRRIPKLHQSTAYPWPSSLRISGAVAQFK